MQWPGEEVGDGLLSFVIVLDGQQPGEDAENIAREGAGAMPSFLVFGGVWDDVDLGTRCQLNSGHKVWHCTELLNG